MTHITARRWYIWWGCRSSVFPLASLGPFASHRTLPDPFSIPPVRPRRATPSFRGKSRISRSHWHYYFMHHGQIHICLPVNRHIVHDCYSSAVEYHQFSLSPSLSPSFSRIAKPKFSSVVVIKIRLRFPKKSSFRLLLHYLGFNTPSTDPLDCLRTEMQHSVV